jgi:transcription elongation GreA/GreB family factor
MNNLKKILLDKCVAQQTRVVEQLKREIDEAQRQSNEYGQPKDRYDAYKTKLMRQVELFSGQLEKANNVLSALHKIPLDKSLDCVEFGALVNTNRQKLFVAASIGKIEIDGDIWFAISPHVPIFKALRGKKEGDSVKFNDMNITIISIQ